MENKELEANFKNLRIRLETQIESATEAFKLFEQKTILELKILTLDGKTNNLEKMENLKILEKLSENFQTLRSLVWNIEERLEVLEKKCLKED